MAELSTIARPYAVAAYKLGKEKKTLAKWSEMLAFLASILENTQMLAYVDNPKTDSSAIQDAVLKVCGDKLDVQGQNLVKILVEYGRLTMLPTIAVLFEELKAQEENTLEAEIIVAEKMTASQTKDIVARLEVRFGKKIEAKVTLDTEIIGGIKIIVGDTVIDASVHGQLQNLAYALIA